MTACVLARPDDGANATLLSPSLPDTPGLMLIVVTDASDAFNEDSRGLKPSPVVDIGVCMEASLEERESLGSSFVAPVLSEELTTIEPCGEPM